MKLSKRRNYLKRTLAFISALSIIGSFSQTFSAFTSLAEETGVEQPSGSISTEISNATYSRIRVDVSNQYDFADKTNCEVKICRYTENGTYEDIKFGTLMLDGKYGTNPSGVVETEHLANGEYYVEVCAEGFKTFSQTFTVEENMVYTVKVTLGFHRDYIYADVFQRDSEGNIEYNEDGGKKIKTAYVLNHPGVLKIGDVNGDGDINARDGELLLEAVESSIRNGGEIDVTLKSGEVLISDINHDGKTSLADVTAFTKNYLDASDWSTEACIVSEISSEYLAHIAENVETEISEGVKVKQEASFAELLNNSNDNSNEETKLALAPANGAGIGTENPVEIAWAIGDGVDMKTLNLDTNATVGEIIVETDDGTDSKKSKPFEKTATGTTEGEEVEDGSEINLTNPEALNIQSKAEDEEYTGNVIVVPFGSGLAYGESEATAKSGENGISVDFGEKIAVKKITIKITNAKNTNLAEIAKVEILNGLEEKMEEPPISYPVNVEVHQVYAQDIYAAIEATWKMEEISGITGYEYEVSTSSATKADGSFVSVIPKLTQSNAPGVDNCKFKLESEHGNFKLIKTNTTYYVHVRAVGENSYKSAWSDSAKVTTKSHSIPEKPDYVKAVGGFKSIAVSWGGDKTNSTQSYEVYYKRAGSDDAYECATVSGQSYTITKYKNNPLDDKTEYEVYVVAKNKYCDNNGNWQTGTSPNSDIKIGETTIEVTPTLPKYKAINNDENGDASTHIVSATRSVGSVHGNAKDNDEENTAWAVVDGDGSTYYRLDASSDKNGITITFDDAYEIGSIGITSLFDKTNFNSNTVQIWYDDANGTEKTVSANNISTKEETDNNKKKYRIMELPTSMQGKKIKKIRIAFNASSTNGPIAISELCFYAPDTLKKEIMELFADDLQLDIRADVTQDDIEYYRYEVKYVADPISGEKHTNGTYLLTVLDTVESILQNKATSRIMAIRSDITTADNTARNFNGLNAWQPIGAVAGKNTEIIVYVGCRTDRGELKKEYIRNIPSELTLVQTQYNSESDAVEIKRQRLEYGENRIQLTNGATLGDAESGGSLYIEYCGAKNSTDHNFIRVSGANLIPMLDIFGVTDINERYAKAAEYIRELDEYVKNIENLHNEVHKGATYKNAKNTCLDHDYKKETCILGATEILDDRMMYSLPATQIYAGLGNGSVEEKAVRLITSMDAMENMVDFFYQHKGISPNAKDAKNRTPYQHLNIRYQRMFANAFMYAAGNHIGIQYGSASGMVNCKGVKSDANGKYVSGSYFGWGIAHEIGHCLNDSNYADAEITNNYFSLLAQAQDKNSTSRLNYNNVFAKVTSGTKGKANQATQLGLYWQLHLAYDNDYNYKTYSTEKEIFDNLFYARMDTYSRNPSKAPGNLSLSGNSDQKLMRLACAAAEKNILEFFERWGKTPDAVTIAYASNFGKEKRAIMYANEDSRVYAMTHESPLVDENGNAVAAIDNIKVNTGTGSNANKVTLKIDVSNKIKADAVLGYEIVRCTISNGDVTKTPIAFSKEPTFTDTVTSYNNRTVSYEVVLVDQHLNRSEIFVTEMIKVHHDGSLNKSNWSISSNNLEAPNLEDNDSISCKPVAINSSVWAIDDNFDTVYSPNVTDNTAEIILNFNQSLVVTGLKYTAGDAEKSIGKYTIFVKNNGEIESDEEWVKVADGTFNGSDTVYFSNSEAKYISTYDTTAVKLQIDNQQGKTLSIAELDVLGVTGDNVDFLKTGESVEAAFGFLAEDYKYGDNDSNYIPAGSLVFTGSYKGHPLYNVVLLYDEEGYLVGRREDTDENKLSSADIKDADLLLAEMDNEAEAHQTILADVPNDSLITNVSEGTWVYWIEPDDVEKMVWPEKVRVELYRVNDAITNEGQRMVSDSLFEKLADKDELGKITLGGGKKFSSEKTTEDTSKTDNE
ncbi:MAG: M60 family metallopeptidase [Ruminococcus sp.]|nr:M60 family metallopeptidase [Ruminococcus sp.]